MFQENFIQVTVFHKCLWSKRTGIVQISIARSRSETERIVPASWPEPGAPWEDEVRLGLQKWLPMVACCNCIGTGVYFSTPPYNKLSQSCLTFCDLIDCSPPGSSVHEILQARADCHSRLQEIFLTQESNLVSCIAGRYIYCLSYQGS